jgi:D-3-phosphoglycerate dehydrogenase
MAKPTLIYYPVLQYQPGNLRLLHDNFEVIELPNPDHDTPKILKRAEVILAPLGYFCGKEKIDSAPNLKVIGSNTTGHPHIDVVCAVKKGIKVVTLKGQYDFLKTITPTAELTWGLIIALIRNMFPSYKSVLDGNWDRRPFAGECMLSRMSLGVAGYGRLGKMVANYGKCFGMTVRYYDPFVSVHDDGIERVFSLKELVSTSDIVTIHIPHETETENLFGREVFSYFKKGSYFINTSRGELVDHEALLSFLKDATLAGAALDVFEDEFKSGFTILEHPLWQYAREHDNLILTPHIGGSTVDAWRQTEEYTISLVLAALED